ncbi:zinc finger domain-containing protein [uncultured Clostridium sp.]|uniref:zinc finger domain-containing protein n=1 Tax=uncultured Clostridium sp. TaxID=59620 RepID=UPI0037DCFA9B
MGTKKCEKCGSYIKSKSNKTKYCPSCAKEIKKEQDRIADKKYKKKLKARK